MIRAESAELQNPQRGERQTDVVESEAVINTTTENRAQSFTETAERQRYAEAVEWSLVARGTRGTVR